MAYPRPHQWGVTAGSTALSSVLTLLPELLAWRATKREQTRQEQLQDAQFLFNENNMEMRDSNACSCGIRLQFRLGTMGCASCVSTVSILLDGLEGVIGHKVLLEDGLAEVILVDLSANIEESSTDTKHDILWKDIAAKLEAAGFPAESVDDSKKHR